MKVKDLIGKIGLLDAYIENEGTNKSWYHDYGDVVIHLITELDGEQFEKDVWSSNGFKIGNGCSGISIFNEEERCNSSPVPPKIKEYTVIKINFECTLHNSIGQTSFGNNYRQKYCKLKIDVKNTIE
jgi:hypothetical protein